MVTVVVQTLEQTREELVPRPVHLPREGGREGRWISKPKYGFLYYTGGLCVQRMRADLNDHLLVVGGPKLVHLSPEPLVSLCELLPLTQHRALHFTWGCGQRV